MVEEIKEHLQEKLIPFWKKMKDEINDGYYGWMNHDLHIDEKAVKGCILNSRIVWFFSNAYLTLGDTDLLDYARHGFNFIKNYCMDRKYGGLYWSVSFDGKPEDTTKYTYNQAFAIYALSSYYDASGDEMALEIALNLFDIIEEKCVDEYGYKEAFARGFEEIGNDKLSENGVIAEKTMNTLLHVFEAYTELYRVCQKAVVKKRLLWIINLFADKVYNPQLHRQEVFFDKEWNSILDLHSYGHDIEAAWLLDRGLDILCEEEAERQIRPIISDLTEQIYKIAYDGHSLANECERGVVDTRRIWWVQAEGVVGFMNGYQHDRNKNEYLNASKNIWKYIRKTIVDQRPGGEWFWAADKDGKPIEGMPVVEPWKCPYHNGRMCFEIIRRTVGAT